MHRFHTLHIFRDYFFCYFEINGYFHFFYLGGGGGGAVEVILEGFICEIESFHIIFFYFHLSTNVSPKSLICPNKQD